MSPLAKHFTLRAVIFTHRRRAVGFLYSLIYFVIPLKDVRKIVLLLIMVEEDRFSSFLANGLLIISASFVVINSNFAG